MCITLFLTFMGWHLELDCWEHIGNIQTEKFLRTGHFSVFWTRTRFLNTTSILKLSLKVWSKLHIWECITIGLWLQTTYENVYVYVCTHKCLYFELIFIYFYLCKYTYIHVCWEVWWNPCNSGTWQSKDSSKPFPGSCSLFLSAHGQSPQTRRKHSL